MTIFLMGDTLAELLDGLLEHDFFVTDGDRFGCWHCRPPLVTPYLKEMLDHLYDEHKILR